MIQPPRFETLRSFAKWYLRDWETGMMPVMIPPAFDRVARLGGRFSSRRSSGCVLFRDGRFQVEMIVFSAGYKIPNHSHPNVDSYDVHLCGNGETYVDGRRMDPVSSDKKRGRHPLVWALRLGAGVPHWGMVTEDTAYLSIQGWRNGIKPSFIVDDWDALPEVKRACTPLSS